MPGKNDPMASDGQYAPGGQYWTGLGGDDQCPFKSPPGTTQPVRSSKMDWDDYVAIPRMNPSTLVAGCKSMKSLKRAIDGVERETTDKMRLGSGLHALLLEPEEFDERFAVVPDFHLEPDNVTGTGSPSSSKSTKYYKARIAEFEREHDGKEILTRKQYYDIRQMIGAIRNHPTAAMWLERCDTEITLMGEIDGVPFKGRVDMISSEAILDVKTTGNVTPPVFGGIFARLRYAFRLAIYRELAKQTLGKQLDVYVIAQEDSGDLDTCVFPVESIVLDNAWADVQRTVKDYKHCLESGVWPGVDGGKDYVDLVIPNWSMNDDDEVDYSGI